MVMAAVIGAFVSLASNMMASDNAGGGGSAQQAADPFGSYRGGMAQKLNSLMMDPSSVTKQPGYQFGLDQGVNTLQQSNAASGKALGGGEQKQITQFGQDYASTQFNNYANMLAQYSGASWQAGGNAANAVQNQNQTNSQNAGVIGQAVGSGIKSLYNSYNSNTSQQYTTDSAYQGAVDYTNNYNSDNYG
jgi:hypothetical protein